MREIAGGSLLRLARWAKEPSPIANWLHVPGIEQSVVPAAALSLEADPRPRS